jgi:prolyl-tRNA synthetase
LAVNQEVYNDEVIKDLGLKKDDLVEKKAIEVGNIFSLGTKFSDALELNFTDEDGKVKPVIMGCYGIGPSRLLGTIVELMNDEKGIMWPESVAPAQVHLVRLGGDDDVIEAADKLYKQLLKDGVEVLYDDRDMPAGAKFADADLIGVPVRVTVSKRTLAEGSVEWKLRSEDEASLLKLDEVLAQLK